MPAPRRISDRQRKILADFMAQNPNFAHNRMVGENGAGGHNASQSKWEELTTLLNSVGGGETKNVSGWKAYWKSWKNKVKAKAAALNRDARGTGGGPSTLQPLTDIELIVVGVIGERAVTGYTEYSIPFNLPDTQPLALPEQIEIQPQSASQSATELTSTSPAPTDSQADDHQSIGTTPLSETVSPKKLSPDYQPLDTSINWEEIIPDRNISKKDDWLKVEVEPAKVYVGVPTDIHIQLRSLYDSILTCNISTQNNAHKYVLELPKIAKVLRPKSIVNLSLGITTDKKFHEKVPLRVVMKDLAKDEEQELNFSINLKSCDPLLEIVTDDVISGDVTFPNAQRGREVVKVLALKSDSNVDLLLEMEVTERFSIHSAKNIPYEAVTPSVNTALRVTAGGSPRASPGKNRMRARGALLKGSALAVTIGCHTPCSEEISSYEGAFRITLMNTNRTLRTVPLRVRVGTVKLHISQDDAKKLCNMESGKTYNLGLMNAGTAESAWRSSVLEDLFGPTSLAFSVTPAEVSLKPNELLTLQIVYKGPPDSVNKGMLILRNMYESKDCYQKITGGTFKTFPIRATHRELSWTKANVTKELRLKNTSDMTIRVKCQVRGEAFKMAVSGLGEIEEHSFNLSGQQCVNVSLVYRPLNVDPAWGRLEFALYDDPNTAKSVRLQGSADKVSLVWCDVTLAPDGLAFVTLPVGVSGHGATLTLAARGDSPAFISASFDYNWRYRTLEDSLRVTPVRAIVRPGSKITLKIDVKNRLQIEEMEGKSVVHLATLEVLTGPLVLKKRLERILESEAQNEELMRQLERLRGHFEGEEQYSGAMSLEGFQESSSTVAALMSELTMLKAEVTLRPDNADTTQAFEDNSIAFLTLCDSSCFPENP